MNKEEIICPGETIKELLETYNYTQNDLAKKLGIELKTTNQILNGEAPITMETALKLEMIFNIDASFWVNREFNYRRKLKQFYEQEKIENEYEKIKNVYKEMIKRNLVIKSKSKYEIINNFKKFMEIVELNDLEKEYNKVFCRKANVQYFNYINLLVWIQIGLKNARNVEVKEYNKKLVYENIDNIRNLTKLENQEEARKKLVKICNDCGIILLFEKSLPNTAIYGIAKWLTPHKPFIQISDRGKNLSTFWFTFMHELGHIVEGRKKQFFVDLEYDINDKSENNEDEIILNQVEELKADKFSNNNLIPEREYNEFLKSKEFSNDSIIAFANKVSIAPYIVAGRIEHDLNEYNNKTLNSFRIKNEFN